MNEIRLFQTAVSCSTLGPFRRFCIWVQGCEKRCAGCVSKEAQSLDGGYRISVEELAQRIISESGIEGITVSGGEPYLQWKALRCLIQQVRERQNLGVIVYTGYLFAEIRDNPLTQLCDTVIDGAYMRELDDGISLRGSSNQQIYCLTDRYRESMRPDFWGRNTELVATFEGGLSLAGIPSPNSIQFAQRLGDFLEGL